MEGIDRGTSEAAEAGDRRRRGAVVDASSVEAACTGPRPTARQPLQGNALPVGPTRRPTLHGYELSILRQGRMRVPYLGWDRLREQRLRSSGMISPRKRAACCVGAPLCGLDSTVT